MFDMIAVDAQFLTMKNALMWYVMYTASVLPRDHGEVSLLLKYAFPMILYVWYSSLYKTESF